MAVGRFFAYIWADWIWGNKFVKVSVEAAWHVNFPQGVRVRGTEL